MTTLAWLAVLGHLFLVMVFAAAALGKLSSRETATHSLATLLPLPKGLAPTLLNGLVAIEAIIAITLLVSAIPGAWFALSFTLGATVALVAVLLRGRPAQCLCFGGQPHKVSWLDAARNGVVAAACIPVIVVNGPLQATAAEFAILIGFAAIGLLLATGLPRIAALIR